MICINIWDSPIVRERHRRCHMALECTILEILTTRDHLSRKRCLITAVVLLHVIFYLLVKWQFASALDKNNVIRIQVDIQALSGGLENNRFYDSLTDSSMFTPYHIQTITEHTEVTRSECGGQAYIKKVPKETPNHVSCVIVQPGPTHQIP